jgi:stage V sporulation protein S
MWKKCNEKVKVIDYPFLFLYNRIKYKLIFAFSNKLINFIHNLHRRNKMNTIKVSANSRTAAVAGAIAGIMREQRYVEVQSIGAGAINQAIKAIILAKGYLVNDGIDIVCIPEFVDIDIEGKTRTAIKIVIVPNGEVPQPNIDKYFS